MTREEIIAKMKIAGVALLKEIPMQNNAVNLYFDNGSNVCVYSTGKYVPGGKTRKKHVRFY